MTPPKASRRYDSTGRKAQAQANRERILRVAQRLFAEHGYTATSMSEIAAEAGVSTPTVFAAFKSKANLLKEAVDVAIVGDTLPIALADRPAMQDVRNARTLEELFTRYAAVAADVASRAYAMYAVAHAAADTDPQIAELVADLDRQRLTGAGFLAAAVSERLGVDDPERLAYIRDTIWTLNSPQLYGMLVDQRGWPVEAYRDWIATALITLVTRPG